MSVETVVTADGAMTPQFVSAAGRHLLLTSRIVLLLVWSSSPRLATGSHSHIYTALRGTCFIWGSFEEEDDIKTDSCNQGGISTHDTTVNNGFGQI